MKKSLAAAVASIAVLTGTSASGRVVRDDLSRPIIAQLLSDPHAYAHKTVTIYGLVIERESPSVFLLQDVSQRPLRVIGSHGIKANVGDQIIVRGVLSKDHRGYYFAARSLTPTRVLGGGGCC